MYIVRILVYGFAKFLVKASTRIFFSRIYETGSEKFKRDKASILVSNHPNTMLDPLNVAERVPRQMVHFLGNAGMFQTKISNWFFSTFFVIPIQRKQDTGDTKFDNKKSFARVNEFLKTGGSLYIAPEGGSNIARRIREVKSGTARMALSAEDENDFKLGLEILPVGLNYTDQLSFRSELFVNVGEPINIADYREAYEKDNFEAATQITEELKHRMEALIVDTENDEEDFFIRKLEEILQTENELPFNETIPRTQQLIYNWRKWQKDDSVGASDFAKDVEAYFSILQKNKTTDKVAAQIHDGAKGKWALRMLFTIFGFPFFVYGWVNNFLANYIPMWINSKMGLYIGYTSCVKTLAGIFTYPIFYGLQVWLVKKWTGDSVMVWGYIMSIILFGLFAWWYKDFARDTLSGKRLMQQKEQGKELRSKCREVLQNHLTPK